MKPITIDYLKDLFFDKYEDCIFLTNPPQVKVTLTNKQYKELNDDFLSKFRDPLSLFETEEINKEFDPEEILHTKVSITGICEFTIKLGDKFDLRLEDEKQEHGDEDI